MTAQIARIARIARIAQSIRSFACALRLWDGRWRTMAATPTAVRSSDA
ncbi:hypothetical protein [Amnibacterium sp.]